MTPRAMSTSNSWFLNVLFREKEPRLHGETADSTALARKAGDPGPLCKEVNKAPKNEGDTSKEHRSQSEGLLLAQTEQFEHENK